jgi:hypothetical protein
MPDRRELSSAMEIEIQLCPANAIPFSAPFSIGTASLSDLGGAAAWVVRENDGRLIG